MITNRTCGVIVCAYTEDRWRDIRDAIAGLDAQTAAPDKVVLVIDHNQRLFERARAAFPHIDVIANAEVRGLSGGRNTGVAHIDCDIVAFLDDDAVPAPDWIERTLAAYDDPAVFATGGLINPVWPNASRPTWMPREYDWTVGCSYTGQPEVRAPVRNPIGANMSFRREVFDLVEPFDSSVGRNGGRPIGCEETELCIRLRQAKPEAVVIYDPTIVVNHRVTPDRAEWKYFRARCFAEGISKATVSDLVGATDGLSAERAYAGRVLTAAARREARDAVNGDREAWKRLGAVVLGVGAAGVGYAQESVAIRARANRRHRRNRKDERLDSLAQSDFEPLKVLDLDVRDLPTPAGQQVDDLGYTRARVLIRDRGMPIAQASVELSDADSNYAHAVTERTDAAEVLVDRAVAGERLMTVVIPTCNRPGTLSQLLESLDGMHGLFDVVIVDNFPQLPQTAQVVEQFVATRPHIRYVQQTEPGASRARNAGLNEVRTKYVAFTDDDVVVDPDWVNGLLRGFAAAGSVVCVTGLVLPAELETAAQVWFEEYGGFGKGTEPRLFDANSDGGPLYPFAGGAFGSGNNVAFDAAWLRDAGGYDERLGPGTVTRSGEDLELFIRVIRRGGQLAYEPSAVVWHRHRRTVSELHRQLTDYGVGLVCAIAVQAFADRASTVEVLRRVPRGVRFLLSPGSSRNRRRSSTFPAELSRAELSGVVRGPFALAKAVVAGRAA